MYSTRELADLCGWEYSDSYFDESARPESSSSVSCEWSVTPGRTAASTQRNPVDMLNSGFSNHQPE